MARQSYEKLKHQIDALQLKADEARKREATDVIERIQVAIVDYKFTAQDLGFNSDGVFVGTKKAATKKFSRKGNTKRITVTKTTGPVNPPKYVSPSGATWTGRGKMPKWMSHAIQTEGKSRDDFLIKTA